MEAEGGRSDNQQYLVRCGTCRDLLSTKLPSAPGLTPHFLSEESFQGEGKGCQRVGFGSYSNIFTSANISVSALSSAGQHLPAGGDGSVPLERVFWGDCMEQHKIQECHILSAGPLR